MPNQVLPSQLQDLYPEGTVTSQTGGRINPVTGDYEPYHDGIDVSLPHGSSAISVGEGKVTFAGQGKPYTNYGLTVEVTINDIKTFYSHLSEISVNLGETVTKGMKIGIQGSTGLSSGEHVHIGIHDNNIKTDPMTFDYSRVNPPSSRESYVTAPDTSQFTKSDLGQQLKIDAPAKIDYSFSNLNVGGWSPPSAPPSSPPASPPGFPDDFRAPPSMPPDNLTPSVTAPAQPSVNVTQP